MNGPSMNSPGIIQLEPRDSPHGDYPDQERGDLKCAIFSSEDSEEVGP